MKNPLRQLAAALASVLLLSGCTTQVNGPEPLVDPSIAAELQSFYSQKVTWSACGGEQTYCGEVAVPLDWNNPGDGTLTLAVAYRQADVADPIGSIIFNPGGPGGSGYSWIMNSAEQLGTATLRSSYNMVGFDPRGVGASEPTVKCLDAQGTDELLYGQSSAELNSAEDVALTRAAYQEFSAACLANTGEALGFIDTVSAAKDMDILRAVFGEEQINYLGFSYGTFLGATYAELFPQRVGRMVLDGAIDPTKSNEEQSIGQLLGFDQALKNYLAECLDSSDCPFTGTMSSALKQISALLLKLESNPVPTQDGRELTIWSAITGMIMPLYSKDYWPYLSQAFSELQSGDGTTFILLADTYNERDENGNYLSNQMEANIAISCLDARSASDGKSMAAQNQIALNSSEVFGRYWQNGALGCESWPFPVAAHPDSYRASGSKTILVIGTTGDPATPYSDAVALANEVLENAQLITWNGEGHTAYGQGSQCIEKVVDDYFIKDVVPTEDPDC